MASQKFLKKKSCLFSVSVYGWRVYQVDAINQFRHMIKTKGLKRPINLFRCVPCPTFTTHFSSSIYVGHQVCLPSFSLSFVFLVICIRFSPQIHSCLLQSIFVFCCLYLCLPLCASRREGMYALLPYPITMATPLTFCLLS